MGKVNSSTPTEMSSTAGGYGAKSMGKDNKNMPLGVTTRANGWETKCME